MANKPQEFFNQVYRDAREVGCNHIQASCCAAQSAIESGWGKSVKGNAYFGVKAGRSWKGKTIDFVTHEVIKGKRVKIIDKFRAYDSLQDSVRDYVKMMTHKFNKAWKSTSIDVFADNLNNGRYGAYATDPSYSEKVSGTANKRGPAAQKAYGEKPAEKAKAPRQPEPRKQTKANPSSPILPLYRPKQADEVTLAVLDEFAHLMPADRRDDKVKVLMVRGYYLNSMGRKDQNDRAIYDDAIFVVSPEGIQPFNGNSDPSRFRKRIATIKANQAIRYRPGLHGYNRKNGPYPAFRQDANCTVVRDGIGDDHGMFHVNFHRGGVNGTSSEGCLTVPTHQWNEFYGLVKSLLDKHGQETFFTTVLEYAGGNPPVVIPEKASPAAPVPQGSGKAKTGLLVGGAIIVSAALEKFSGWLSSTMEWIGSLL